MAPILTRLRLMEHCPESAMTPGTDHKSDRAQTAKLQHHNPWHRLLRLRFDSLQASMHAMD